MPLNGFKDQLSSYELTQCSDKTKLWIFLSMSNYVEVYSNVEPKVEKVIGKAQVVGPKFVHKIAPLKLL